MTDRKTVPRDSDAENLLTMFGNCINDYFNAKIAEYNAAIDAAPAEPAPEPTMTDAAEMLWVVVANVSGGDWTKQTQEWQEAAARWRDYYHAALSAQSVEPAPEGFTDCTFTFGTTGQKIVRRPAAAPAEAAPADDLCARLIAAGHDERLATGALYLKAADRIAAQDAAKVAAEQDAARYRFLRNTPVYDTGIAVADVPDARDDIEFLYDAQLDSAVDRARAKYKRDKENADR